MIPAIEYIERFLYIKTKEGKLQLLKLNVMQKRFYNIIKAQMQAGKPVRIIVLKARQLGFSTFIEALIFYFTVCQFAVNSFIIAHKSESSAAIYDMAKLFYDMLPNEIKPMQRYSNAKQLVFDNPSKDPFERMNQPGLKSSIRVAVADNEGVGRGMTLHYAHLSEYAFWKSGKKTILNGLLQAVPNMPGTMVFIESTANGYEHFKELWDEAEAGMNGFTPVFFAWHDNPAYSMPYSGFELNDEEKILKERFNLTNDQLEWRRWCIKTNCSNDLDLFKQEYPSYPEEAFLMTGRPVFNNRIVQQRLLDLQNYRPLKIGRFFYDYDGLKLTNIRFVEMEDGEIEIYELPQERNPYVLGGDTAGEGSDWFIGDVLNNMTGKQAAMYRYQVDEDLYAKQIYCLGMYYNQALIGVEINYSTYPEMELERLEYPNLYVREIPDTYQDKHKKAFGFRTTSLTRPAIIDHFKEVARENIEHIYNKELLKEMLSFVKNDQGRPEAAEGSHDDCVMAHAITLHLHSCGQQTATLLRDPNQKLTNYEQIYDEYEGGEGYDDIYDY